MDNNKDLTIFDFIRADGYMTVNKKLAQRIGLNEAVVYGELVSRYLYFKEHDKLEDGYFFNTVEDLQEATTLTKYQQSKAIEKLYNYNLIDRKVKGVPAKRYFKINEDLNALHTVFKEVKSQLSRNLTSCSKESEQLEVKKLNGNNNNYKNNQEEKSIGYRTFKQVKSSLAKFDFSILEKQIRTYFNKNKDNRLLTANVENVIKVFKYFMEKHKTYCRIDHPKISQEALENMLYSFPYVFGNDMHGEIDIEHDCYFDMIDFYWQQALNSNYKGNGRDTINYSIMHFMSGGIKDNCFYKTCY